MNLLIVDDSMVMRDTIGQSLSDYNVNIMGTASNGKDAIQFVEQNAPDIVTLDITMPEMDGLDCLDQIMKVRPETQVIIITALADKLTGLQAIEKGAVGFLLKPIDPQELKETFEGLLN